MKNHLGGNMKTTDRIIHFIIAICLLLMVYNQYRYVKSDWCSYEVEKLMFTIDDIAEELNVN
jgi:hypothetical protein